MAANQSIDLSWLHHSNKNDASAAKEPVKAVEATTNGGSKTNGTNGTHEATANGEAPHESRHIPFVHKPHLTHRPADETPPGSPSGPPAPPPKDPKNKTGAPEIRRRGSWITNISSKFSSSQQSASGSPAPPKITPPDPKDTPAQPISASPASKDGKKSEGSAAAPPSPKASGPSFLQSALRRLSSSTGTSGGKAAGSGGLCPRKVMNVDPYRERCQIEDLHPGKLRRVSFSVDVEIAAPPRYEAQEDDLPTASSANGSLPPRKGSLVALDKAADAKKSKEKEKSSKMKDLSEGEALKHPETLTEVKEAVEDPSHVDSTFEAASNEIVEQNNENGEKAPMTRKKEKKKRSEEERKERKERKRQAAVANGTIPIEISLDHSSSSEPPSPGGSTHNSQDKPTTDPLRIYRRCCQLRETLVLKRIADQLSSPASGEVHQDGTVPCIDLTGLKIPLADTVTLGDYLAIMPVRKLILEDCDLTDESVRVVLAGLLAVKTPGQAKINRRLPKRADSADEKREHLGVIEKLSLKDNPKISREGWKHISLFLNMSRSIKAVDFSGIKFPAAAEPSAKQNSHAHKTQMDSRNPLQIAEIYSKCLSDRLAGSRLEELVMAKCGLDTHMIESIVRASIACGIKRLGLAYNNITEDGLPAICNFLQKGNCEGLDLGGNRLAEHLGTLADAMKDPEHQLFALSLADCDLTPASLKQLLPTLVRLPNFKFIDLSHNRSLFATQPNATSLLRKYLPQMQVLKRIHLNDVALDSEQAIALAEVLPEITHLSHIGLLENPELTALASAKDEVGQEEACAYYASLMIATRVSKSIVSLDIDMPTRDTSELVQAVAKQMMAYALRNMERGASVEILGHAEDKDETAPPDILVHLVGQLDGFPKNHEDMDPAPNDHYIVSGTAVVKALGICLGNKASDGRRPSRPLSRDETASNKNSGANTPHAIASEVSHYKAKEMSMDMLDSARKIRERLQIALARQQSSDDEMAYKRLQFLDSTLTRMIERFEEEYPESKLKVADGSPEESTSLASSQIFTNPFQSNQDPEESAEPLDEAAIRPKRLSRRGSDVSLASRSLANEEGQMHRFGQQVRRSLLAPSSFDYHHLADDAAEPDHLKVLRNKLEELSGSELKDLVSKDGVDQAILNMGANANELLELQHRDPEGFRKLVEAQRNAAANTSDSPHAQDEAVED